MEMTISEFRCNFRLAERLWGDEERTKTGWRISTASKLWIGASRFGSGPVGSPCPPPGSGAASIPPGAPPAPGAAGAARADSDG